MAVHHALAVPVDTQDAVAGRIYQGLWCNSQLAKGIALAPGQRLYPPSPSVLSRRTLLYRLGDIALVSCFPAIAARHGADADLAGLVRRR